MNTNVKRRAWLTPMLYMAPALLIYVVFLFYPLVHSLILSLYQWDSEKIFVGLDNYKNIFTKDPVFKLALINNVKWTVVAEIVPVTLGLIMALLMGSRRKGFGFYRNAIFFPTTLSMVIVGLMWNWMYNPMFGLINNLKQTLFPGSPAFDWLQKTGNIIYFLTIAASWGYTGICMIMFITGLQTIPAELYEAAAIDGANKWQQFRFITVPQLMGTINIVIIYTLINSFKVFDVVVVMTGGGPGRATNVLATWAYTQMFTYHEIGKGCATAWVLTVIVFLLSSVYQKLNAPREN